VAIAANIVAIVAATMLWARTSEEDRPNNSPRSGATDEVAASIKALPRRDGRRSRKGSAFDVHPAHNATLPVDNWLLAASVVALTGFATLTYEIAWTRVFALTTGPSTYAFAATLATVVAGIAIGSVVGAAMTNRVAVLILTITLVRTAAAAAWAGSVAEAPCLGPSPPASHGASGFRQPSVAANLADGGAHWTNGGRSGSRLSTCLAAGRRPGG
jgi:hypothetical protein